MFDNFEVLLEQNGNQSNEKSFCDFKSQTCSPSERVFEKGEEVLLKSCTNKVKI